MVIAALFTIAKLWKKPQCPLLMNVEILLSHKEE
jgi:hypothetical protein